MLLREFDRPWGWDRACTMIIHGVAGRLRPALRNRPFHGKRREAKLEAMFHILMRSPSLNSVASIPL